MTRPGCSFPDIGRATAALPVILLPKACWWRRISGKSPYWLTWSTLSGRSAGIATVSTFPTTPRSAAVSAAWVALYALTSRL